MQTLRFLVSPSGRLPPRVFVFAALVIYLAGGASHLLTAPGVVSRAGLWPFAAVQALLIWIWFVLHAKRLRDGGGSMALAAGASILYALSVLLLVTFAAAFTNAVSNEVPDGNSGALGLILVVAVVAILLGSSHIDWTWLVVALLLSAAVVPLLFAVFVTFWAATRPSVQGQAD
jgi:hypothetical protein